MNTFNITVTLSNNIPTTFIVIPHDNHENSYPTYFELLSEDDLYTEIRLNDDLVWEVCKGDELDEADISLIITEIEMNLYGGSVQNTELAEDRPDSPEWINKLLDDINNSQSAA